MKTILAIFMSLMIYSCAGQNSNNVFIETSDIVNFWTAYGAIQNSKEKSKVFTKLYLDKASVPFKKMIGESGDIRNVENYLESFEKYPKFWESLRKPTMELQKVESEVFACYDKVEKIYPEFKAGNVCVFIGVRNIQASVWKKDNIIFMGGELNLRFEDVDLTELEPEETFAYQNSLKSTIIHETIHLQQKADSDSLLGHSIHEGSADFLAELFLNEPYKSQAYNYGKKNEKKLWIAFSKEMYSTDLSNWLYGESGTKDRPADLGYFMGYMITKSYYDRAKDKDIAIHEIIEVTDFIEFLKISGYEDKFEE